MKLAVAALRATAAASLCTGLAHAQPYDMALLDKWGKLEIVHYNVTGELTQKHVQIPSDDADLYADVVERVTLSFDWNRKKNMLVGPVTFHNEPAKLSNLEGMDPKCPTGKVDGAYEHFDVVEAKQTQPGSIELVGKRIHPVTHVAESCGAGTRTYKAATRPVGEHIGPPDPIMLAYAKMMTNTGGYSFSPDGRSIVLKPLNNNWTWTFTPVAK